MRRSIKIITAIAVCCVLLFGQSLTCFATDQPPSEGPKDPERPPFLTLIHTSIPDNSTPEKYNLPGNDWDVYDLAEETGGSFEITLFGNISNVVTVEEMDEDLFGAELNEKLAILGHEIDLTYKLNELILVPADGGSFPRTKNNGQMFTGTMQILPYNGVIHHIVISEVYTVQPGDNLGQIILDCGWLPEGRSLYGQNGYLAQYAEEQHFDLNRPLIPGEVILWHSEDIQVVDNLYPDIEIDFIPGNFFSAAEPMVFDEEADIINALPIVSDFIKITHP